MMVKQADDLAKEVLARLERSRSESHLQECISIGQNLIIHINNEVLDSVDPGKREELGLQKIEEYFNFLGFNDVIEKLEYLGENKFKVQVANIGLRQEILKAQSTKIREGTVGAMYIRPDLTQLRQECQELLLKEQKLRYKISSLRSDPWIWTIKGKKVVPVIDEMKNDPEAMQRLADELKERVEMFKKFCFTEEVHKRAYEERKNEILMRNDKKRGSVFNQLDRMKVKTLFNELGISYSKVKKVEQANFKDGSGTFPLIVTLEDGENAGQILRKWKNHQFISTKEEWMKSICIDGGHSYLHRYILNLSTKETFLRNRISWIKGDHDKWVVKGTVLEEVKCIKMVENGVSKSHDACGDLESDTSYDLESDTGCDLESDLLKENEASTRDLHILKLVQEMTQKRELDGSDLKRGPEIPFSNFDPDQENATSGCDLDMSKLAQDGIIFESDSNDDSDLENDLADDDLKKDTKHDPYILKLAQDGIIFESDDSDNEDSDPENDLADRDPKIYTKCDLDIMKLSQDGIVHETNEPDNKK